ncbi:MAG TPA: IS3 family transposase [Rhodoferax sp.]|nr:IS3 family transposase [Rhodoferax sp.]
MSHLQQRKDLLELLQQACTDGARMAQACSQIGLSVRTVQRWQNPQAQDGDRRLAGLHQRAEPANKLSEGERQAAMAVLNGDAYKNLPPSQIVPRLADQGRYIASESTLYRLLRQAGQMTHRRPERAPQKRSKPRALTATEPDQIYCWDITYLPTQVRGSYFYLYLFVDLFSRKIVGWQVYDCESAELAGGVLQDICTRQGIAAGQLVVHSDNGAPMKGETMLATMQRLGVAPSRSRPSVSNDNPYSESLFRTLKYRPAMPVKPFENLLQARRWVTELVHWYNEEHRHSAIGFVTPTQRHAGQDKALLKERVAVYELARQTNPLRWSKQTRDWSPVQRVELNPDKPNLKDIEPIRKVA